ncbi:MAG: glycosyltransferase, partial [Patescibacteria group bacterium]
LGSLKLSPKIWQLIFAGSSVSEWPLKILNMISAPFLQEKFLDLMRKKKPTVLVSTFPVWDILIKKTWKDYSGGRLPFISVITDSISVHNAWTIGDPDYFIVANDDTKIALKNLGIAEKRIRTFGYPVSKLFSMRVPSEKFKRRLGLSANKKTLLLILSVGINWAKTKKIIDIILHSKLKDLQLIVINCAEEKWMSKLKKIEWPWPTHITGWTNAMHSYIHASDIILTKAGGATVMECIASQRPMIIVEAIPGQEIGNAMLVQKYNLGMILENDMLNFDNAVQYILDHDALIKRNLAAQQKPNAACDIANFLIGLS